MEAYSRGAGHLMTNEHECSHVIVHLDNERTIGKMTAGEHLQSRPVHIEANSRECTRQP